MTKDELRKQAEAIVAQQTQLRAEREKLTDPERIKEADAQLAKLERELIAKYDDLRYFREG